MGNKMRFSFIISITGAHDWVAQATAITTDGYATCTTDADCNLDIVEHCEVLECLEMAYCDPTTGTAMPNIGGQKYCLQKIGSCDSSGDPVLPVMTVSSINTMLSGALTATGKTAC